MFIEKEIQKPKLLYYVTKNKNTYRMNSIAVEKHEDIKTLNIIDFYRWVNDNDTFTLEFDWNKVCS